MPPRTWTASTSYHPSRWHVSNSSRIRSGPGQATPARPAWGRLPARAVARGQDLARCVCVLCVRDVLRYVFEDGTFGLGITSFGVCWRFCQSSLWQRRRKFFSPGKWGRRASAHGPLTMPAPSPIGGGGGRVALEGLGVQLRSGGTPLHPPPQFLLRESVCLGKWGSNTLEQSVGG